MYPAYKLFQCKCGHMFVDVGFRLDPAEHHFKCDCGQRYYDGVWWMDLRRFRSPNQPQGGQMEITFTETVTRSVTIKVGLK
jgi:hypothetical protein